MKAKSWLIIFEDNSHSFSTPNCKFAQFMQWAITPQQLKCTLMLLSPFPKPKLEVIYWPEIVQYNSRYHSITVRPPQLYNFHKLSKIIFFQRELRFHEKTTALIVSKSSCLKQDRETVIFQQAIRLLAGSNKSFSATAVYYEQWQDFFKIFHSVIFRISWPVGDVK